MNLFKTIFVTSVFLMGAASALAEGTLLIKVHYQGEQYDVVSVKHIPQTFPSSASAVEQEDDLLFRFSDDLDATLAQGRIKNPKVMRPVLTDNQDVDHDHDHVSKPVDEGVFMLRYPYEDGLRFLQLMESASGNTPRSQSAPAPKIDLKSFMAEK